jgi:hypothetical protein
MGVEFARAHIESINKERQFNERMIKLQARQECLEKKLTKQLNGGIKQ